MDKRKAKERLYLALRFAWKVSVTIAFWTVIVSCMQKPDEHPWIVGIALILAWAFVDIWTMLMDMDIKRKLPWDEEGKS